MFFVVQMDTLPNFATSFMENKKIRLVECPRDAMQGWKTFIFYGKENSIHQCTAESRV